MSASELLRSTVPQLISSPAEELISCSTASRSLSPSSAPQLLSFRSLAAAHFLGPHAQLLIFFSPSSAPQLLSSSAPQLLSSSAPQLLSSSAPPALQSPAPQSQAELHKLDHNPERQLCSARQLPQLLSCLTVPSSAALWAASDPKFPQLFIRPSALELLSS